MTTVPMNSGPMNFGRACDAVFAAATMPDGYAGHRALVAFALVRPSMLHPLNVAWMKLGLLLGRVVTPIVMLLVFVVAVLPTGLVVRAMGKDLLLLKRAPTKSSYWIRRDPPGPPPESLKDQF